MSTTTLIKGITVEKALAVSKSFASKRVSRPILTTSLVTASHVITTDSHRLIRITHGEDVAENYVHNHYEKFGYCGEARNYPDVSRIVPLPENAKLVANIDVNHWLESHKLALKSDSIKKNQSKIVWVRDGNRLTDRDNELEYAQLAVSKNIDNVAYNCKYMIDGLTALKKLKVKQAKLYFYGPLRPLLFVAENVEVLILPCRIK